MRKFTAFCLMVLASASILMSQASVGRSQEEQGHVKWVEASLREMETIKVGMTRADLLKVFMEEGGISTRTQRTYVYRHCSYFKVTVEFKPVENERGFLGDPSTDKIVKISEPFLQWSVLD
jgi:hypothetical protein